MTADDRYQVSDQGRVRRASNKRIRKPSSTPTGYQVIVLSRPGASHAGVYVHREVMKAFVGSCPEGFQVSHVNGDNSDNRLVNLRYESARVNNRRKQAHGTQTAGERHGSAKLTWSDVRSMRRLLDSGLTLKEVAEHYGVSFQQVSRIKRGHNWQEPAHIGKLEG